MNRLEESVDFLRTNRVRKAKVERFAEFLLGVTHPNMVDDNAEKYISWFVTKGNNVVEEPVDHWNRKLFPRALALKPAALRVGSFTVRHVPILGKLDYVSQLVETRNAKTAQEIHEATDVLATVNMHGQLWFPGQEGVTDEALGSAIVVTNEIMRQHSLPLYEHQ